MAEETAHAGNAAHAGADEALAAPAVDKPYFYDVAEIDGFTMEQVMGDSPDAEEYIEAFGRHLVTKAIVRSPQLNVFHEKAAPGEKVRRHRHGTLQATYMLSGELIYGNRRLTAGMGHVNPDTLYAWRAGEEGAEWIEIHAGQPGLFLDRPDH